jgi:hypothetical protein
MSFIDVITLLLVLGLSAVGICVVVMVIFELFMVLLTGILKSLEVIIAGIDWVYQKWIA